MKKVFTYIVGILLAALFSSCSKFSIFTDIPLGCDIETASSILDSNKIKYKAVDEASIIGPIDLDDPEQIADLIINYHGSTLGEMLYKKTIYFWQKISPMDIETRIYFYKGKCSNIELNWYGRLTPSLRNGYIAAETFASYINRQFPDLEFTVEESIPGWQSLYTMNISDTVSITIEPSQESFRCIIEDSEIQKDYKALKETVNLIVKENTK